jgi:hypothetical protein
MPYLNLDRLSKIRGVTWEWKDKTRGEGIQGGVIAQEVQEIMPDAVIEQDGILMVDYTKVTGLLVEAVKELKQRVEELENGN